MPFPDEIMRVAMLWTPNTDEWPGELAVNTFHLQHQHVGLATWSWSVEVQGLADKIAEKLATHWGTVSALFGSGFQISAVKTSHLDSAGHALEEGVSSIPAGTLVGTGTSGVLPPEVAICLSLYGYPPGAFVAHRGQKRGRMYLPYISATACGADGKLTSGAMDLALAWQNFFNDVQGMHSSEDSGIPDTPYDTMSLVVVSKIGALATQVDHLRVDNFFDSQRRRQHQSVPSTRTHTIDHG